MLVSVIPAIFRRESRSPTKNFGDDRRKRLSFNDASVESFEDDCHEIVALGAFDLLEGLDVLVFGAVHDGQDFCDEVRFIA